MAYFKQVLDNYFLKVHALILVGGFRHSTYLLKLIKKACKDKKLALIIPSDDGGDNDDRYKSFEVVCGAIFKSMDTSAAQDPVPKIQYSNEPEDEESDVIVYIGKSFNILILVH